MAQNSGLMQGKRGVILGVANNRSIAWGIAKACHAHGAEIAFTYQGDALKKRVEPLAKELGGIVLGHCDVTDRRDHRRGVRRAASEKWGKIDFVVHAIAFSDKDQLDGRYVDTTADNFSKTMLITCYSFTAIAQRAEKLMTDGGSILTLTYYGAEKWMPHYNVMGVAKAALEASVRYLAADLGEKNIRVNAISAGPIKTLAASGIGDFRYILKWNEYNAPLRRNVTIEEVGDSALYLLSDMSRGVTGEVHHVDSGYHVVGMKRPDAPDISLSNSSAARNSRQSECPRPRSITFAMARPWNARRPAAGRAGHSAERSRPQAGGACRQHPRRSVRARRPRQGVAAVRREPARPRARDHGAGARRTETAARGLCARRSPARDRLRPLGRLDAGRDAGCAIPSSMPGARPRNGRCRRRAARAMSRCRPGCAIGTTRCRRDTVAVAHGGTARALMVALGIETPASAADLTIEQGAVYVFRDGGLKKYS